MILFCAICGALLILAGVIGGCVIGDELVECILAGLLCMIGSAFVVIPLAITIAAWNGGVEPNYSRGYIVGTIIRAETTGVIADTCEITIQQGLGEHRESIDVSAPQCAGLGIEVGAEVKIDYTGYWIPDFRQGWSGRYVNRIMTVADTCSL